MNKRVTIGSYEATCVRDTPFGADGGALFGIVPKALWSRKCPVDSENRVFISLNSLLLRGQGKTLLFDVGIGNKLSDKQKAYYGLDPAVNLVDSLAEEGVDPSDIDVVVPSHLHLDHAGWLTVRDVDGTLCPTFPNADVYIQKQEWDFAHNGNELTSGSYMRDDFAPLSDMVTLVDGDHSISDDIRVELTGAHTPGHQVLRVTSGNDELLCPADILPTTWQMRLTWVSGFDLDAAAVVDVKKVMMAQAAARGSVLFLDHEPVDCFGTLDRVSEKDYTWLPVS